MGLCGWMSLLLECLAYGSSLVVFQHGLKLYIRCADQDHLPPIPCLMLLGINCKAIYI